MLGKSVRIGFFFFFNGECSIRYVRLPSYVGTHVRSCGLSARFSYRCWLHDNGKD